MFVNLYPTSRSENKLYFKKSENKLYFRKMSQQLTEQELLFYTNKPDDNGRYYVAFLKDVLGQTLHSVAIDIKRKTVLDCCDSRVLKLNKETLNICCGKERGGFQYITNLYEMVVL